MCDDSTCRVRYACTCGEVYPASTAYGIRGTSISHERGAGISRILRGRQLSRVHCGGTSVHHASGLS